MAYFCKQCSEYMFGKDYRDLAELLPADKYDDCTGASGICEGCSGEVFDIDGQCVDHQCPVHKGEASTCLRDQT